MHAIHKTAGWRIYWAVLGLFFYLLCMSGLPAAAATGYPDIDRAIQNLNAGKLTPADEAVLVRYNKEIGRLAYEGAIKPAEFTAAQGFYDSTIQNLSQQATDAVGVGYDKQPSSGKAPQPATDTDNWVRRGPDGQPITTEKVQQTQEAMDRLINDYVTSRGQPPLENPTKHLEIDFMPPPVEAGDNFRNIAQDVNKRGGVMYEDPTAVKVEVDRRTIKQDIKAGRTPSTEIKIDEAGHYQQEMQRQARHQADLMPETAAAAAETMDGARPGSPEELTGKTLQTEVDVQGSRIGKYGERMGDTTKMIAEQSGIEYKPAEHGLHDPIERVSGTRDKSTRADAERLGALEQHVVEAETRNFARTSAEAARANPALADEAARGIATSAENLNASQKGEVLETVRKANPELAERVRQEMLQRPGPKPGDGGHGKSADGGKPAGAEVADTAGPRDVPDGGRGTVSDANAPDGTKVAVETPDGPKVDAPDGTKAVVETPAGPKVDTPDGPAGGAGAAEGMGAGRRALNAAGQVMAASDILNTAQDVVDAVEGRKSVGEVVKNVADNLAGGAISTTEGLVQKGSDYAGASESTAAANAREREAYSQQVYLNARRAGASEADARELMDAARDGNAATLEDLRGQLAEGGVTFDVPDAPEAQDFEADDTALERAGQVAGGIKDNLVRAGEFVGQTGKNLGEIGSGLADGDVRDELAEQMGENLSADNLAEAPGAVVDIYKANRHVHESDATHRKTAAGLRDRLIRQGATPEEADAATESYLDDDFKPLRDLRDRLQAQQGGGKGAGAGDTDGDDDGGGKPPGASGAKDNDGRGDEGDYSPTDDTDDPAPDDAGLDRADTLVGGGRDGGGTATGGRQPVSGDDGGTWIASGAVGGDNVQGEIRDRSGFSGRPGDHYGRPQGSTGTGQVKDPFAEGAETTTQIDGAVTGARDAVKGVEEVQERIDNFGKPPQQQGGGSRVPGTHVAGGQTGTHGGGAGAGGASTSGTGKPPRSGSGGDGGGGSGDGGDDGGDNGGGADSGDDNGGDGSGGGQSGSGGGGDTVVITQSGTAGGGGGGGAAGGTSGATSSGSGGYAAAPQDQTIDGSSQLGGRTVTGVRVSLTYDAYGIPDQFQILYQGAKLGDSGMTSGGGSISGSGAGSSPQIVIRVITDDTNTSWEWSARVEYTVQ